MTSKLLTEYRLVRVFVSTCLHACVRVCVCVCVHATDGRHIVNVYMSYTSEPLPLLH